jgi:hypothetical protein
MTFLDNGEEKLKKHEAIIKCLQKTKNEKTKKGICISNTVPGPS